MEFGDLRDKLKELTFDSLRIDCDNFFEAVILRDELDKLNDRLGLFFGSPVWPSKSRLPLEVQTTIESVGGLVAGQTLYFAGSGESAVFAMLWPWRDGTRTTLKVIKK